MKRKPTFAPYIGTIDGRGYDDDCPIPTLAYQLDKLLKTCRVDRATRKAHVALLRDAARDPGMAIQPEYDDALLDALIDALSHYAPPYTYFGELDGEWGFWPLTPEEVIAQAAQGLCALPKAENRAYWGGDAVLLVNDHGNVECGRFDKRGRFHSYWSAV